MRFQLILWERKVVAHGTSGEAESFYGSRCLECSPEHGHQNKFVLVVGMTQQCGFLLTKFGSDLESHHYVEKLSAPPCSLQH